MQAGAWRGELTALESDRPPTAVPSATPDLSAPDVAHITFICVSYVPSTPNWGSTHTIAVSPPVPLAYQTTFCYVRYDPPSHLHNTPWRPPRPPPPPLSTYQVLTCITRPCSPDTSYPPSPRASLDKPSNDPKRPVLVRCGRPFHLQPSDLVPPNSRHSFLVEFDISLQLNSHCPKMFLFRHFGIFRGLFGKSKTPACKNLYCFQKVRLDFPQKTER